MKDSPQEAIHEPHRPGRQPADGRGLEPVEPSGGEEVDEHDVRLARSCLRRGDANDERVVSVHRRVVVERRHDDRVDAH